MKERCLPKDSKSGESRSGAEASLVQNNWLNRCGNALWNRPVSQKPTTIPGQTWCAATPASPSTCGSSSESCCSSHTTTAAASAGLTKRKVRPHGHVTDWRKPRFPHLSRVRTFRKRPDTVSFLEGWRQSDCKNLVEEKKNRLSDQISEFFYPKESSKSKTPLTLPDCGASGRTGLPWTMTNSAAPYVSTTRRASFGSPMCLADWCTSSSTLYNWTWEWTCARYAGHTGCTIEVTWTLKLFLVVFVRYCFQL